MKRTLSLIIVLLALAGLFAAAVAGAQPAKSKAQTRKGKAPVKTASKAVDAAALYKQHCKKCHAEDGKGIPSLEPPDMTSAEWQSKTTDQHIIEAIAEGKGIMPGFKDTLKPAEIEALAKYVRTLGAAKSEGERKPGV